MGPIPIHDNKQVLNHRRGDEYKATESPKAPKLAPEEDPIMAGQSATPDHIFDIIAQGKVAIYWERVGAGATNQYVKNPHKADINPGTPDRLKLDLKAVEAK